jgi:hypothetical protein
MPRPDGSLYHFERDKPDKPQRVKVVTLKPKIVKVRPIIEKPDLRVKIQPTKEYVAKVSEAIAHGAGIESALVANGMSRSHAEKWLKQHTHARLAFEEAEAKWECGMAALIHGKASADYKAAAWLLERRTAARWAAVSKTELTGKNGGAMQVHSLSSQLLASVGGDLKQAVPV